MPQRLRSMCLAIAFHTSGPSPRPPGGPSGPRARQDERLHLRSFGQTVRPEGPDFGREVVLRRRSPLLHVLVGEPSETAPGGRCPSESAAPGAARRAGSGRCRSTPTAAFRRRLRSSTAGTPAAGSTTGPSSRTCPNGSSEHRAQNASVVDDPVEDLVQELRVALRERDEERCRHVLHEGPLAARIPRASPGRRCRRPAR